MAMDLEGRVAHLERRMLELSMMLSEHLDKTRRLVEQTAEVAADQRFAAHALGALGIVSTAAAPTVATLSAALDRLLSDMPAADRKSAALAIATVSLYWRGGKI